MRRAALCVSKIPWNVVGVPVIPMYRCENCRKEFESQWTDADALLELQRNFPGLSREACMVVCEVCYQAALAQITVATSGIDNPN